ncbi:hypothetical protein PTTG_30993, partial [Puccinia triticina 1-1 BBBD Race 1]
MSQEEDVTDEVSQENAPMRACQVDTDDPRLPELQEREHAEHARLAFKQRIKQKARARLSASTSEKRAALIDQNAMLLAEKLKAFRNLGNHKRKAQWADGVGLKKRRVTLGKYKLRRVQHSEKASFLWCFDRRGGSRGL